MLTFNIDLITYSLHSATSHSRSRLPLSSFTQPQSEIPMASPLSSLCPLGSCHNRDGSRRTFGECNRPGSIVPQAAIVARGIDNYLRCACAIGIRGSLRRTACEVVRMDYLRPSFGGLDLHMCHFREGGRPLGKCIHRVFALKVYFPRRSLVYM